MPEYGRSAADAAYEDDAKNFGKLPTPRTPESLLDRLERLRAEPTKGITDPGAGDYSLLLLRMAPDLITAARALGAMIWVYDNTIAKSGGYSTAHVQIEWARAAWEKVQ